MQKVIIVELCRLALLVTGELCRGGKRVERAHFMSVVEIVF